MKKDVEPIDSSNDPATRPDCVNGTEGTGGMINRLEEGPNGQLFMKHYMLTEKCVNGHMRSFTKKLN